MTVPSHGRRGLEAVEQLANAVLYEGCILYPYRSSSTKNRQRWNFGTLYPQLCEEVLQGREDYKQQTECLVIAGERAKLFVRVRFLHFIERVVEKQLSRRRFEKVDSLMV